MYPIASCGRLIERVTIHGGYTEKMNLQLDTCCNLILLNIITNNSRYMSPNTTGVVESLYEGPYRPNMKPATGSFARTCSKCKWMNEKGNAYITCDCKRRDGTVHKTTLTELRKCRNVVNGSPQLSYINGNLWCQK